jgi:uncharacterized membrane protein
VTGPSLMQLERKLGRVLVTGVMGSAVLLTMGLSAWFWNPASAAATWLLNAGVIVLMATPILRVIVSVAEFVHLRQWFFVAVTLIVLAELAITVGVALTR